MVDFYADPRDGREPVDVCGQGCCCAQAEIMPGEVQGWRINYAGWIAGLRAKGLVSGATEIAVMKQTISGEGIGADLSFTANAPGVLNASAALPTDQIGTTYQLASQPNIGQAALTAQGDLTYTTNAGAAGIDSFIVAALSNGQTIMRRISIAVTALADFSFIGRPGAPLSGSIVAPTDSIVAVYQLFSGKPGASIGVEQAYGGQPAPATLANMTAAAPNFITTVQTKLGNVQLRSNGSFLYQPLENAAGLDTFVFSVLPPGTIVQPGATPAPGVSKTAIVEIPEIWIDANRVSINNPILSFPVAAQKNARIGDVYRVSVFQTAQDCNGCNFRHASCYDVTVGRC